MPFQLLLYHRASSVPRIHMMDGNKHATELSTMRRCEWSHAGHRDEQDSAGARQKLPENEQVVGPAAATLRIFYVWIQRVTDFKAHLY